MPNGLTFDEEELLFELPEPTLERFFPDPTFGVFDEATRFSDETIRWLEDRAREANTAGDIARDKLREDAERKARDLEVQRAEIEREVRADLELPTDPTIPNADTLTREALRDLSRDLAFAQAGQERQGADIIRGVETLNEAAEVRARQTAAQITGAIGGSARATSDAIRKLEDTVAISGEAGRAETRQLLRDIPDKIKADIAEPLLEVTRESARAQQIASNSLTRKVVDVSRSVGAAVTTITSSIAAKAAVAAQTSKGMLDKLEGLGAAFIEGTGKLSDAMGEAVKVAGENLLGPQWMAMLTLVGLAPDEAEAQLEGKVLELLRQMDPDSDLAGREWSRMSGALPDNPILQAIIQTAIFFIAAPRTLWDLAGLRSKRIAQEYNLQFPTELMPVPDLIDAWRRDLLSETKMLDGIRRQGYSPKAAADLALMRRAIAPPDRLVEWWLLGILTDKELASELRAAGVSADDTKRYKTSAFPPPPIGDLIRFAVREVFSPELRKKLDLDANYPERLTELAAKRGLSEEWARDYWAAHWELPGIGQAFSMRHRDAITDEELDALLQARDVAPVWRDKLKAIAFTPLSRVDLRRMYAMGVLDRAGLVRGYLDLGNSPKNAELLADFAIQERAKQKAELESPYRGLTTAQMRDAVSDGLLTRDEVGRELEERGFTPEAANIFLALTKQGTPTAEQLQELEEAARLAT